MNIILFLARSDRYSHDVLEPEAEDTEDDADDIMFHSFSSYSPRYSKVQHQFDQLRQVRRQFGQVIGISEG